jgi:pyruvate kinase
MSEIPFQKTKILATVGPACNSYEGLLALAREGVDVFRLNFSHGSHEDHEKVIKHIQKINEEFDMHVSILCDLQGPKLRVGKIKDNALPLINGDEVTFVNKDVLGTKEAIYMSYKQFPMDVHPGEKVLLDDGKLVFEVVETNKLDTVKLKVLHGGILSSNKGVNLPDTNVSLPALTDKDKADLKFMLEHDIHWIALSFVRTAKDLIDLRKKLDAKGHPAKIIAKIEKPEAIKNIDEIIKHTNGIMIARGDLAVEVPMEQLPFIQKSIVRKCIQWARPVVVATQMMDSMITNPSPTRAEITDVANAVYDGADALMLSGETSVGAHPILVVQAMRKIIAEAELHYDGSDRRPVPNIKSSTFLSDVVCFNAAKTAEDVMAKCIVGMTTSGYTAFKISAYRPNAKICIFSDDKPILNILNLVRGVKCYPYHKFSTTDETIQDTVEILKEQGEVFPGDLIINTGSMPLGKRYRTNMMKVTIVE